MLIASYNPKSTKDTLILVMNPDVETQAVETKGDIVRIFDEDTNQTLGYNIFNISKIIPEITSENGQVNLSEEEVSKLNDQLTKNGFSADIVADNDPKFVVGYVKSIEDHPDSDHLKITHTQVDDGQELQIVSGSPNMQADIKVVVAKVGAMMPDGLIIWPGKLRGVKSDGMIVSGRELKLKNAPQVPGALILPNDFQEIGQSFDFDKAQNLFN
ncbi:YtpR family tRNA-binding protein [Lentilactobacillus laojiaonis]|uniref:YtpR family tRNA-binding protein n=1 Tax=Lentilactobacillus laojiaonis TaxID=2883998 RepID=UPI001D0AB16B|nr:DUF4479 and tRNA-binding domain-containing protein [Lentilactobacillus laojiaonis]UDM32578.1 DUF4479 and tRNA-binding domain-containing protein [Lentilactobacillus laojiaonis]